MWAPRGKCVLSHFRMVKMQHLSPSSGVLGKSHTWNPSVERGTQARQWTVFGGKGSSVYSIPKFFKVFKPMDQNCTSQVLID